MLQLLSISKVVHLQMNTVKSKKRLPVKTRWAPNYAKNSKFGAAGEKPDLSLYFPGLLLKLSNGINFVCRSHEREFFLAINEKRRHLPLE